MLRPSAVRMYAALRNSVSLWRRMTAACSPLATWAIVTFVVAVHGPLGTGRQMMFLAVMAPVHMSPAIAVIFSTPFSTL